MRAKALVSEFVSADARALDLGCGAGHLSFLVASHVASVVALDPSPGMLVTVANSASARGLPQIETQLGSAESLPFPDKAFSLVCTRYSAHHWAQLETAVQQMHRVVKPGGYALVIDVLGDDDVLTDTHLQTWELLRDASHVRNQAAGYWKSQLTSAGFEVLQDFQWPLRLEFGPWVERMRTPSERVSVIRSMQLGAPREVQERLSIESDGSFTVRTGLFWAHKSA